MSETIGVVSGPNCLTVQARCLAGKGRALAHMPDSTPPQLGPNCGFYALAFALKCWQLRLKAEGKTMAAPLPARYADNGIAGAKPATGPAVSLRQIAKTSSSTTDEGSKLTYIGELFSGHSMVEVARKAGYLAQVHRMATTDYLKKICQLIDAGIPVVVPMDVDGDPTTAVGSSNPAYGCPGEFKGDNAHWVTVVGYYDDSGTRKLIHMNWGKFQAFNAEKLLRSSENLQVFGSLAWRGWKKRCDPTKTGVRGKRWTSDPDVGTIKFGVASTLKRSARFTGTRTAGAARPIAEYSVVAPPMSRPMAKFAFFHEVSLDLKLQIIEVIPPAAGVALSTLSSV